MRKCRHLRQIYADISFQIVVAKLPISIAQHLGRVDGQNFQMNVYLASHPPTQSLRPCKLSRWIGRAVVVLIGIRLGIDGVNPIYHETITMRDSPHFSRVFY